MKHITVKDAAIIIKIIALQHGVTEHHVRMEMKKAMISGLLNPNPRVQALWKSIPCEGEYPTPEEFIVWTANRISDKREKEPNGSFSADFHQ